MTKWKFLIGAVFVAALLCGCGMTAKTVAYKSLSSVAYAVDGAMKVEAAAYVKGQVNATNHAKVAFIKDKQYNPAFATALNAAKMDWTAPAPASVNAIAADLIALIDSIVHPKPVTP